MRLSSHIPLGVVAPLVGLLIGYIVFSSGEPGLTDATDAVAGSDTPVAEDSIAATETATPSPTATPLPPTPTPTPAPPSAYTEVPFEVPARAVAILEAPCGALLYGKDEHVPLPPASLTKIVTALTAIDRVNLADRVHVKISGSELKVATRSSIMGLEPGMNVSVEDLFYGLFLPSGNDAAIELAEHVSGDVESFVAMMNEEAQRLGMYNTHLSNPHGLGSRGMQSTAYDMAIGGMALMGNPTLAAMAGAPSYSVGDIALKNGNQLLGAYAGSDGVKIGYTRSAGHTIVGSAIRDGRHIFVAVFNSDNLYPETMQLFDWAYSSTEPQCTTTAQGQN
jgi:D-alanyl-D-alanine carboxypeptidase (penicillin-binding protein 5/6)